MLGVGSNSWAKASNYTKGTPHLGIGIVIYEEGCIARIQYAIVVRGSQGVKTNLHQIPADGLLWIKFNCGMSIESCLVWVIIGPSEESVASYL